MNNISELLRPFALSIIDKFGSVKTDKFVQLLEAEYKATHPSNSIFEDNRNIILMSCKYIMDVAVKDWLKIQYDNYPHKTERDGELVISAKVLAVETLDSSKFGSFCAQNNQWPLWHNLEMKSGYKVQIIQLADEEEPYYIVWSGKAKGIVKYNILDFRWHEVGGIKIILKDGLEGHGIGFSGSTPIKIRDTSYPSITSAYNRICPDVTYSTVCSRRRKGMSDEDAFYTPNQRQESNINKLGVIVNKRKWVKSHKKIGV